MTAKNKRPLHMAAWRWGGGLLLLCMAQACVAQTQEPVPPTLVLGTARPDGNYAGVLLRRLHQEAFRRLGVPVEVKTLPTARLSIELASDKIDGDVSRPWAFADTQPNLIRVDEPILHIAFALWAVHPHKVLQRLDQLQESGLSVAFTRGVVECEQSLKTLLPPHRVIDTTTTVNALNLLHRGRVDLHCGPDIAILSDAGNPEFVGLPTPIKLFNLGEPMPLYLYLQRKHSTWVPKLLGILKKMKTDGSMDQIRRDVAQEYKLASAL
jgi:hypothetical protein